MSEPLRRRPGTAILVVIVAAALAILVKGAAQANRDQPPSAWASWERDVLVEAQRTGKVDTVALGDSITQMIPLDNLCGRTFNAGVSGATIDDVRRMAPSFLAATHPGYIVLGIGTNDVLKGGEFAARFRASYSALLASLPVKPFALVGVANGDNGFIAGEAARIGAAYIPPLPRSVTWDDGIHPDTQGQIVWRSRVEKVCPLRHR